jgi:hypothetical protein
LFVIFSKLFVLPHKPTYINKGKGTVYPRTGYEGTEEEQMYGSALPSVSALDGGG